MMSTIINGNVNFNPNLPSLPPSIRKGWREERGNLFLTALCYIWIFSFIKVAVVLFCDSCCLLVVSLQVACPERVQSWHLRLHHRFRRGHSNCSW